MRTRVPTLRHQDLAGDWASPAPRGSVSISAEGGARPNSLPRAALRCRILPPGAPPSRPSRSTQRTPLCLPSATCLGWTSIPFLFYPGTAAATDGGKEGAADPRPLHGQAGRRRRRCAGVKAVTESANPTASLRLARPGLAPELVQSRLCEPAGRVGKFALRMANRHDYKSMKNHVRALKSPHGFLSRSGCMCLCACM